jgi:hypothetical protein
MTPFEQATITFLKKILTFSLAALEKAVRQGTCRAQQRNLRQQETLTVRIVVVVVVVVVVMVMVMVVVAIITNIIMKYDGCGGGDMLL